MINKLKNILQITARKKVYNFKDRYRPRVKKVSVSALAYTLIIGIVLSISQFNAVSAATDTKTIVPNGDNGAGSNNWATNSGSSDSSCSGGVDCDFIDEDGETDYLGTGTGMDATTALQDFDMSDMTPLGSFNNVTAVTVTINAQTMSCLGGGSNCDGLSVRLYIDGAFDGTPKTVTNLGTSASDHTFTWTGLTEPAYTDIRVEVTRVVEGTGSPSSKDDDVRMYDIRADITYDYTIVEELDQAHFRWRDDTQVLDTAPTTGYLAAEDSNSIDDIAIGETYRLRLEVDNISTTVNATNKQFQIEFAEIGASCSAATGWVGIGDSGSDAFEMVATSNYTEGEAITTDQFYLTGDETTKVAGEARETADTTGNITLNHNSGAGDYTELEYSFRATSDSTEGTTYCFRVTDAGAAISSYSVYPQLTVRITTHEALTLADYIWENDDGSTADGNTIQENGNTAITGVRKGERLTLRAQIDNTGDLPLDSNLALFYDRGDGFWSKVKSQSQVGTEPTSGSDCENFTDASGGGSTALLCEKIIDGDNTNDFYNHSSLAFSPNGTPYILTTDYSETGGAATGSNLILATYVGGSSGSCENFTDASGGGSTAWNCEKIIDGDIANDFNFQSSLAFSPNGTPYILTTDYDETGGAATGSNLILATYVGGSSGSCENFTDASGGGSTAWNCEKIIDGDHNSDFISHSSLAFSPNGTPYILTTDYSESGGAAGGSNLILATYVGSSGSCENFTDASGGGSTAWNCEKIIDGDNISDFTNHSSLAFSPNGTPYILTTDNSETGGAATGSNLILATYVGSSGSCENFTDASGGGSTAWNCEKIIDGDHNSDFTSHSSLAFSPNGTPYILTTDYDETGGAASGNNLILATYVGGSSGSCENFTDASGGGSTAWNCEKIIDGDSLNDFRHQSSLAFSPNGTPYILTTDYSETGGAATGSNLILATYVGSSGSCENFTDASGGGSTAWNCEKIIDGDSTNDFYNHSSLAFSPNGTPYILTNDFSESGGTATGSNLVLVSLDRKGEIILGQSLLNNDGDATNESHADSSGGTKSGGTNCSTAGASWNAGAYIAYEEGTGGVSLPAGDPTAQCTELQWVIDTSQAQLGQTYRFIIATDDGWNQSKGKWRGPIAIDNYPTLTIENATSSRYSKGLIPTTSTDCQDFTDTGTVGSAAWNCEVLIDGDGTFDFYNHSSLAFSPHGTPYVLVTDRDEATGGTLGNNLVLATYVGSGGSCVDFTDTGTVGSAAWNCEVLIDGDDTTDFYHHSPLAFSPHGTPYVLVTDRDEATGGTLGNNLVLATYVGSGGSCVDFTDTGTVGSAAWNCEVLIDGDDTTDFYYHSSLAFSPHGTPYVLVTDIDEATGGTLGNNLVLATYVGSGGSCVDFTDTGTVGSAAWNCEVLIDGDDTTDFYNHSSLAFSPHGTPYVLVTDRDEATGGTLGNNLVLATYVGSGGSCVDFTDTGTVGSAAWNCEVLIDGDDTTDFYNHSSLAFSSNGTPHALVTDYDEATGGTLGNNLVLATYVGSGGSCVDFTDTGTVGSAAWNCEVLIDGDDTTDFYDHSSLAFSSNGTPHALVTDYDEATGGTLGNNLVLATYVGSGGSCVDFTDTGTVGSAAWNCEVLIDGDDTFDFYNHSPLAFSPHGTPYVLVTDIDEATGGTLGNNLVLAKLALPNDKPSAERANPIGSGNAGSGDLQYHLDIGKSLRTDADGTCDSLSNYMGYCGLYTNDTQYESITAGANEMPMFAFAQVVVGQTSGSVRASWTGQSTVAASTNTIRMQAFNVTTSAWTEIDTDSSCAADTDCTLTAQISPATYTDTVGSTKYIYIRVYQDAHTASQTLRSDYLDIDATSPMLRLGNTIIDGVESGFAL